ncbi:MAG: efflux transporter outer membrane subunit [Gammaproteobacteria bacterium]|nr:efflux transporter outer membrane subunit [Gammaproteobacteria bacterium]MCY4338715.1 efflux transporter outer membrane subunit [Gammaproteobacteria bacterium]
MSQPLIPLLAAPITILAGGLVCGCVPNTHLIDMAPAAAHPVAELPQTFAGAEVAGAYQPQGWWQAFADPALDRLIETALAANFELAEAVARVEQARARERIVKAPALPLLQPTLDITDTDIPTNAGIAAQLEEVGLGEDVYSDFGLELPERLGLTTYTLSAQFSYELDFWGRNHNDARAAGAELLAQEADYLTARMGVLAETVRTYLEIVDLRRQRGLAEASVALFRQREALAGLRYDRGRTDTLPLYAARRDLRNAEAQLPQFEALLADAHGRLGVLLGGYPADPEALLPATLAPAAAPEPVPVGIPADLLAQRPDVRAARQRLEAARYTVGARRADLWPSLSLYGSIGLQSTAGGEWFDPDQWFRNLSFNLLGPVLQGSRLRSNVALAEARLDEAAAAYGRSVVTAVQEVEAALTRLQASRRRHALLSSLTAEARAEAALQEQRYVSGVGEYESFLGASQRLLGAQSGLAAAQRELGYARLALHRALGGAWTTPHILADTTE